MRHYVAAKRKKSAHNTGNNSHLFDATNKMQDQQSTAIPLPAASDAQSSSSSLARLSKGDQACISAIASPSNEEQLSLRDRLEELGFLPGEMVRVVATAFPSGDPIAVRIGNTTFALRRHEAEMIFIDSVN